MNKREKYESTSVEMLKGIETKFINDLIINDLMENLLFKHDVFIQMRNNIEELKFKYTNIFSIKDYENYAFLIKTYHSNFFNNGNFDYWKRLVISEYDDKVKAKEALDQILDSHVIFKKFVDDILPIFKVAKKVERLIKSSVKKEEFLEKVYVYHQEILDLFYKAINISNFVGTEKGMEHCKKILSVFIDNKDAVVNIDNKILDLKTISEKDIFELTQVKTTDKKLILPFVEVDYNDDKNLDPEEVKSALYLAIVCAMSRKYEFKEFSIYDFDKKLSEIVEEMNFFDVIKEVKSERIKQGNKIIPEKNIKDEERQNSINKVNELYNRFVLDFFRDLQSDRVYSNMKGYGGLVDKFEKFIEKNPMPLESSVSQKTAENMHYQLSKVIDEIYAEFYQIRDNTIGSVEFKSF